MQENWASQNTERYLMIANSILIVTKKWTLLHIKRLYPTVLIFVSKGYSRYTWRSCNSIEILGRSQWPRGLRRGCAAARLLGMRFRIRRGSRMSLSCVVSYQIEVSSTDWSRAHRSPTKCGVSGCGRAASIVSRSWPSRGCRAMGG
jgi:hypothetical protein